MQVQRSAPPIAPASRCLRSCTRSTRQTGRELWNSGTTIASFAHGPTLWSGIGQIHVATFDNTVYAFGFPLERY
jgi:hypothetical protein